MNEATIQSRIIFPSNLNDHGTLFGGTAIQWMDEVAYITALRYSHKKMVTISINHVHFLHPLKPGMIAEIKGTITTVGKIKLEVLVEITSEEIHSKEPLKSVEATFTLVAVDNSMKAVRL